MCLPFLPKVPSPWLCLSCQVALICSSFVLSFLASAKGETWEPSDPLGLRALLEISLIMLWVLGSAGQLPSLSMFLFNSL